MIETIFLVVGLFVFIGLLWMWALEIYFSTRDDEREWYNFEEQRPFWRFFKKSK